MTETTKTPEEWLEEILQAITNDGGDLNGGHDYTIHTLAVIKEILMPKTKTTKPDEITLKWGTLKGWDPHTEVYKNLLQKYFDLGVAMGAAQQNDTDEQKKLLIQMVSLPGMKIYLDWDGKYITKDEAVKYLTEYGQ